MPFIHNPGASESLPPPWESLPTVQASDQQELLSLATKLYYADPSSGQNMSEFSTPVLQQAYPMTRLPDELGYDTASFSSSDQAASSEFSETASMSTIRSASSEQVPGSTFRPSSPAKLAPPLNPTNPLQCHQCDQIIKNPANLRRHLRTVHQPGVRHPCTRCRKTLSRGDALKRHMKSHCP
ncbi:hypothetical protein DFQ28_009975 [Apophysomyces sp. BC1034]|nr:hypothetical protein DFQ30_009558 [Apophysomyces sp. BC1015]KAG0172196.1 hypothetical protein DFQ29_008485 [Apophysomyces sp. BC1021]KAG0185080.1 hypothetical protein DFQ28_009975 [Apophysomyces sp. BC1034]